MAQLNMMHFLMAKKLAAGAPGANRAALLSAMSKDPLTAYFAGRSARFQRMAGVPVAGRTADPEKAVVVFSEEDVGVLRGVYQLYTEVAGRDNEEDKEAALRTLMEAVRRLLAAADSD